MALILPKDMPFSYAAAVDLHYTKHKSYWPVGGASEIPFHMVPVIEMSGKTLSVLSLYFCIHAVFFNWDTVEYLIPMSHILSD